MNHKHIPSSYVAIMGMGKTGIACARFLTKQGVPVHIMDNRINPPGLATVKTELNNSTYTVGRFDSTVLAQAREIVISPGLSLTDPALTQAMAVGIPILSEIELFARNVNPNVPIVAITGSNGKSTVTSLVGDMAKHAGWKTCVGGNLGTPALDLLSIPDPGIYVLELSSFQLETTDSLKPKAVTILNLSEDHLDRYTDFAEYAKAKQRIYQGDSVIVVNQDDPEVVATLPPQRHQLSFSIKNQHCDFCLVEYQGETYLASGGNTVTPLLPVIAMQLHGTIMWSNALAALALGKAVGLPMPAMLEALRHFQGLPHRCTKVATIQGVDWFNDSKGTNVGATVAAIQGLNRPGQVILIAGGEGKGADFSPLTPVAQRELRACVLIGRDAPIIAKVLQGVIPVYNADSMNAAVQLSTRLAQPGDAVLLSPACASFDMFDNYEHRGEQFVMEVKKLVTLLAVSI